MLCLLRNLGLVNCERSGRHIRYSLYNEHVAELIEQAIYHAEHLQVGATDRHQEGAEYAQCASSVTAARFSGSRSLTSWGALLSNIASGGVWSMNPRFVVRRRAPDIAHRSSQTPSGRAGQDRNFVHAHVEPQVVVARTQLLPNDVCHQTPQLDRHTTPLVYP